MSCQHRSHNPWPSSGCQSDSFSHWSMHVPNILKSSWNSLDVDIEMSGKRQTITIRHRLRIQRVWGDGCCGSMRMTAMLTARAPVARSACRWRAWWGVRVRAALPIQCQCHATSISVPKHVARRPPRRPPPPALASARRNALTATSLWLCC